MRIKSIDKTRGPWVLSVTRVFSHLLSIFTFISRADGLWTKSALIILIIVCLFRCRLFSYEKQTESLSGKKNHKPFYKLIRNLLKFQFFLVIIYITVKKFLNHLILYFKISSIGSILRWIESDMDLVIPKTMEWMDWWHTFFFDFPIVFRVYDFFFTHFT